jgi:hypothetical protein
VVLWVFLATETNIPQRTITAAADAQPALFECVLDNSITTQVVDITDGSIPSSAFPVEHVGPRPPNVLIH